MQLGLLMNFLKFVLFVCLVARIIKTQRQILGFNLKIRKTKQPATGSYLNLGQKMVILPLQIFRLRLSVRPVSPCLTFLASAGIKGTYHLCPVSMAD